MWGEGRFLLGFGISGIGKPDRDVQPTLTSGGQGHIEITNYFSLGLFVNVHLRNWEDVPRVYRDIKCDTGDVDCKTDALLPVAWGVVFGAVEAGWEFTLQQTRASAAPWFSFGSGFVAISDAEKVARAGRSQIALGHAARIGIGWDVSEKVGLGIRTTLANNTTVFRTSGPSIFSAVFSVEFREWSDWNKPAPKKTPKKKRWWQ